MAGGLRPLEETVHDVVRAMLEELAARGSWLRGSPGELLADLEAEESATRQLVRDVCCRLQGGLAE